MYIYIESISFMFRFIFCTIEDRCIADILNYSLNAEFVAQVSFFGLN